MLFWVAVLTGAFDFGIRTSHNLSWPLSLRQWVWNWKRFKVDGRRELLCILVFRQAVCDLLWFIFCCFLSEICKWCLLVSFICYTLCLCQRQSCGDLGFKRQHVRVFFFLKVAIDRAWYRRLKPGWDQNDRGESARERSVCRAFRVSRDAYISPLILFFAEIIEYSQSS